MPATADILAGLGERAAEVIAALYERVTGQPYWTARNAAGEFGPPLGAVYQRELAELGDYNLDELVRELTPAQLRAYLEQMRQDRVHELRQGLVRVSR
jgi:hypothetical protein